VLARRARALTLTVTAAACGSLAILHFASPRAGGQAATAGTAGTPSVPASHAELARGRALFVNGCSSCHGLDARGVPTQGPSLRGAGAAATDFYLRTGRMPLSAPGKQPLRAEPRYDERQIEALVAYIGSFGGPPIPTVDPARGSQLGGFDAFNSYCAGCHSISGVGGVVTGAYVPPLLESTPTEVGEAIRTGPYVMPRFSRKQINDGDVDSIARYVALTQNPDDAGGWGIGHIGPVPEGLVAWALAAVALLLVARLIGERGD
jgi:quinol---cytochrome-c reductase cytochrome c subunit